MDVGVQRWEKDKGDLRMQFILKDKELKDRAATEDRDEERTRKKSNKSGQAGVSA